MRVSAGGQGYDAAIDTPKEVKHILSAAGKPVCISVFHDTTGMCAHNTNHPLKRGKVGSHFLMGERNKRGIVDVPLLSDILL